MSSAPAARRRPVRVTLFSYANEHADGAITLSVESDGSVLMSAYDGGDLVMSIFGDDDYEYSVHVPPAAVPDLYKKLTGHKVKRKAGVALVRELERRYHDDPEAVDKFRALCERLGVKHDWKTWI